MILMLQFLFYYQKTIFLIIKDVFLNFIELSYISLVIFLDIGFSMNLKLVCGLLFINVINSFILL